MLHKHLHRLVQDISNHTTEISTQAGIDIERHGDQVLQKAVAMLREKAMDISISGQGVMAMKDRERAVLINTFKPDKP